MPAPRSARPRSRPPGGRWRDRRTSAAARSPVDLPEHDVERAKDRGDVGQQVALTEKIHRLQMRDTRCANFALVGLVGAVGDQINAELALGRLDGGVDFASRY